MCSPAAIVGVTQAGINIAGAGMEAKARDIQAQHAWASAEENLGKQYNATQLREVQEMQRTQLQVFQAGQQATSNASRLRAQAAAGSVAGHSIEEREAQPGIAATNFAATAKMNLASELRQNQLDAESFKARAQSIINENQPVSGAALGLTVAKDLVGAAAPYADSIMPGGDNSMKLDYAKIGSAAPASIDLGGQ